MNSFDILRLLTVLFTGLAVLVPVIGLTLRFTIKPFFDTWAEIQRGRYAVDQNILLARQLSLLETEVQEVQRTLQAVVEGQEFQRQLARPDALLADRRAEGRG